MSNLNRMIKMEITFYTLCENYTLVYREYYLNNADNFLLKKILIREN